MIFFNFFSEWKPYMTNIVRKVLTLLEACFDLISPPSLSMKIQIPALEGQNVFVLLFFCSFYFQILHTKLGILDFNHFLITRFVI